MKNQEITAILKNWIPFGKALYAEIYEDKKNRWPDGHKIKVSRILSHEINKLKSGDIIETANSTYLLE